MIGRFIAFAALVMLLLSGARVEAAAIHVCAPALAAAGQQAMADGCSSCDSEKAAASHCGPFCIPAVAILGEAPPALAPERAGYGPLRLVAAALAVPEPDHSPPR